MRMRNFSTNHFIPILPEAKKRYELYKAHHYISSHAMNDALRKTFNDMLGKAWEEHRNPRQSADNKKRPEKEVAEKATDTVLIYSNDNDNDVDKTPQGEAFRGD